MYIVPEAEIAGLIDPTADSDGDGLPDAWERDWGGNGGMLEYWNAGNADADDYRDGQEFILEHGNDKPDGFCSYAWAS